MRRLAVLLLSVATIATVVIVAVTLSAGASDTEGQRLLSELPQLPGSSFVEVTEYPYYNCGWPFRQCLGLGTTARYQAPATATAAEIVEFYTTSLEGDWTYSDASISAISVEPGRSGETLGEIPAARFVRGAATVHISTDNMVIFAVGAPEREPTYDFTVSVDAEGTAERPYCD